MSLDTFGDNRRHEYEGARSWPRNFKNPFRLTGDPNVPRLSLRLVRQAWELSIPFWTRPGAWVSYFVLAIYAGYAFGSAFISARIAKYIGDQLDALARHDSALFYRVLLLSFLVDIGRALLHVLTDLPFRILLARWRQWLTERFVGDYLKDFNYYLLNRDRVIDNPDERIAVDIAQFVYFPTDILFELVRCLSNVAVFGYVLWSFRWYLVPACAVYYLLFSVVSLIFSKPILNLSYEQRRLDGNFRFSLVNVRVNAESIAFNGGERVEKRHLHRRLALLIENAIRNSWWTSAILVWSIVSGNLSATMPGLLIAPLVFRGILNISAFSQAQNAWRQLGSAFAFVGDQATTFAEAGALIGRLHDLQTHCARDTHRQEETSITRTVSDHLATENLTILTPGGERTLIHDLSLQLSEGGLIVIGGSGVGKSSLLRALAGLWTRGSGSLTLPPGDNVMFLPQRPYMSLGTLREQITYPQPEEAFTENAIREALAKVSLGHLEDRLGGLGAKLDWMHVLSPGEQQRLAFGRALLRRPDLVILDEATSAIDVEGEQSLYALLQQMGSTYLSVAHRISLYPFHDRMLELKVGGAWEIKPIEHGSPPQTSV